MTEASGTPQTFREALLAALKRNDGDPDVSIRQLAHTLAATDGRPAESHRRALQKYVKDDRPTVPTDRTAAKIAAAIGLPDDYFATALASSRHVGAADSRQHAALEARVGGVEDGLAALRTQVEALERAVRARGSRPRKSGADA